MKIENAGQGRIFYGIHFYPGVAEYAEPGKDPYRVFLNEDTIRAMSPTFAGRPVFVEHIDEVETDINELRKEADGWVVESFYNAADGKTWVKFIVVSDRGYEAIRRGFKLSNAYHPRAFSDGGLWNGVSYAKEVTAGEYDHLAIVRNPRYEESTILTPEEFKLYNSEKELELKRLANSKDEKGDLIMFFKRTKVENAKDYESLSVVLPKSKKEMTIGELVNAMDLIENMHGYANDEHMVKCGEDEMSVKSLVKKHMAMNAEMEEMKKKKEDDVEGDSELKVEKEKMDVEGDMHNEESEEDKEKVKKENKEDAEEIEEEKKNKKKNELEAAAKKKENFDKLKNAHITAEDEVATVCLMEDQVARGKARYGSSN